jgi:ABC-2 type transport system permease protein
MFTGTLLHLLFTLRLNFRSKQAMIYGYLVPIFFLFAFGTLFRGFQPMGQLLTISVLGGACFGMPTAMVADRERGVWRRYRLLPASTGGLVLSTMIARYLIVGSAAIMQILLARWIYKTAFPLHPLELLVAFTFVAFSFEAMGLVIAAAADNVPAVQALGQAIFLPVIIIGGVGVPLATLPGWAQKVAGFFPGRYAVEAMQSCFDRAAGWHGTGFDLIALTVIGIAGCIAGARLFRWDANQQIARSARGWVVLAVASWIAVGATAAAMGHLAPVKPPAKIAASTSHGPWEKITRQQIDALTFTGLPPDDGTVAPVAPSADDLPVPEEQDRLNQIRKKMQAWPPGHDPGAGQRVRNYLSAAAIADYTQDPLEGAIARAVFDQLKADFDPDELIHILAWIILEPDQGTILEDAPALDIHGPVNADTVRQRDVYYAQKLLGRLLGKLPDVAPAEPTG